MAAAAVAIQGGDPPRLPAAACAGRLRVLEKLLHGPHRDRARAQAKSRGMTQEALIGLIMLVVLLGAIFIGVPISFTLLFLAFTFGYFGMGAPVFDLAYLQIIGLMKEELFAAVPLFIFMGFVTEQAGL